MKQYLFRTISPSEAVVMMPETEEQVRLVEEMARLWKVNHLSGSGTQYAEMFAKQHGIRYRVMRSS